MVDGVKYCKIDILFSIFLNFQLSLTEFVHAGCSIQIILSIENWKLTDTV